MTIRRIMNEKGDFYTLRGYRRQHKSDLTEAMEDYLEMLCRLLPAGAVRVGELAGLLHVRPSSVSKMVANLARAGYLRAGCYGEIALTEKGGETGRYLLVRHETVHRFLCLLNGTDCELEQAEKIEHFLDRRTVDNLRRLTERFPIL